MLIFWVKDGTIFELLSYTVEGVARVNIENPRNVFVGHCSVISACERNGKAADSHDCVGLQFENWSIFRPEISHCAPKAKVITLSLLL